MSSVLASWGDLLHRLFPALVAVVALGAILIGVAPRTRRPRLWEPVGTVMLVGGMLAIALAVSV